MMKRCSSNGQGIEAGGGSSGTQHALAAACHLCQLEPGAQRNHSELTALPGYP